MFLVHFGMEIGGFLVHLAWKLVVFVHFVHFGAFWCILPFEVVQYTIRGGPVHPLEVVQYTPLEVVQYTHWRVYVPPPP